MFFSLLFRVEREQSLEISTAAGNDCGRSREPRFDRRRADTLDSTLALLSSVHPWALSPLQWPWYTNTHTQTPAVFGGRSDFCCLISDASICLNYIMRPHCNCFTFAATWTFHFIFELNSVLPCAAPLTCPISIISTSSSAWLPELYFIA